MAEQKLIEREWMPLFTPGFDTDILADTTPQQLVARVIAYDREVANLIAAAPELLNACDLAVSAIESLMDELGGKRATDWGKVNDAMIALGRARAEAKGQAK